MPQPLDPAAEALMASAPRHPLAMPNPALSLAERAWAFRARNDDRCQISQGRGSFRASLSGPTTWRWAAP
jgi:hypothetical protein